MRHTPRLRVLTTLSAIAATLVPVIALTGCAGDFGKSAAPMSVAGTSLSGSVHGGQQPVSGANVYLMAAGKTGYGSAAASQLTPGLPGVTVDGNGRAYVTTDAGGNWSITGAYTCNPTDQMYIIATGGNPGLSGGATNSSLAMMNALGSCSSLSASTSVIVNEATTVAAVTALQQFMTDATHVGSSSTNTLGIKNAFSTATNLVATGATTARATTPAGNGTVPQATLHSLANAMAACANTSTATANYTAQLTMSAGGSASGATVTPASTPSGSYPSQTGASVSFSGSGAGTAASTYAWDFGDGSTGNGVTTTHAYAISGSYTVTLTVSNDNSVNCHSYFAAATPSGGAAPSDTVSAMLNIARNPGVNVGAIFNLSTATPPFQPTLTSAPTDYSLGVTYALGGVPEPGYLAIDAAGNVWSTNRASEKSPFNATDSIVELSPLGAVLSGPNGYTAGGVNLPEGIAVDLDGQSLWVANSPGSVLKLTSAGAIATGFPVSAGIYPQGIAIDTGGNAWVSNSQGNDVMQISGAGTVAKSGISATNFSSPQGVALDYNGNVYIVGQGSSSILKLDAAGTILSTGPGFTGAGLNAPSGVAIGLGSRIWAVNTQFSSQTGQQTQPASFSVLTNTGAAITGNAGYGNGGSGVANIVAIDGAGSAWTALCVSQCVGGPSPDAVVQVSFSGAVLSPAGGFQNPGLQAPQAVAIDASGNVWVANSAGRSNSTPGSITQLVGLAAPVKTPVVAQISGVSNLIGTRP